MCIHLFLTSKLAKYLVLLRTTILFVQLGLYPFPICMCIDCVVNVSADIECDVVAVCSSKNNFRLLFIFFANLPRYAMNWPNIYLYVSNESIKHLIVIMTVDNEIIEIHETILISSYFVCLWNFIGLSTFDFGVANFSSSKTANAW